jgi:hypothetical protein
MRHYFKYVIMKNLLILVLFVFSIRAQDLDESIYCAEGCRWEWTGDAECDLACNVTECNFDEGDCPGSTFDPSVYCAEGCEWQWINDGECDPACQVASDCSNDMGDCL